MADSEFWRHKSLGEMSPEEWESLCDGCARCCVHQLEDEASGQRAFTDVACRLLDIDRCRCTDYRNRCSRVPTCMVLTPENIAECASFAPSTCAYRQLFEGKSLAAWHPLVSKNPDTVHLAGISVRHKVRAETEVNLDELHCYMVGQE